ncbi:MAG: hypothetical protein E7813_03325 [Bradyrhizobium sp.]|uniref:hypothetical protein n=1 Tax=Bradyrhizobium sp. TaxID=376 RepID=UPI001201EC1A|nr:hypothetical protein [Bradyrhizobium sp.]THD73116.1 MAG: hypothetical protein E7813_03325 [Bradyrhizobium sp.]
MVEQRDVGKTDELDVRRRTLGLAAENRDIVASVNETFGDTQAVTLQSAGTEEINDSKCDTNCAVLAARVYFSFRKNSLSAARIKGKFATLHVAFVRCAEIRS